MSRRRLQLLSRNSGAGSGSALRIDPELEPQYYNYIKQPISLRMISETVDKGGYKYWRSFESDVRTMLEVSQSTFAIF